MISLSYLKKIKEELEKLNKGGCIQIFLPFFLYFDVYEQRKIELEKYKGVRYILFSGEIGEELPNDTKELIERCNKAGINIYVLPILPQDEEAVLELAKKRDKERELR